MQIPAIRKRVSAWPGVTKDVKWGHDLVFSVRAKMFCAMDASGNGALGFKVEPDCVLELTDRLGIIPAPYLARAHWCARSYRRRCSVRGRTEAGRTRRARSVG